MADYVLDGLLRWLNRGEWEMELDALCERHTKPAARELELDSGEMMGVLGHHFAAQIGGWVFEDLVTRRLEGGRNLADDYLKRRGWKETARGKAYIGALRDSVVSLYEVSGLVPGESFLARDLIRGGEPVRVQERSGSRSLRPWSRLATRILPKRDGFEMSGGALVFDHHAAEELLATLRRDVAVNATTQAWTSILADAAPTFAKAWLLDNVPRLSGKRRPMVVNGDGDALMVSTTLYPLRSDVSHQDLTAALERVEWLTVDGPAKWSWMGEARRAPSALGGNDEKHFSAVTGGDTVLGTIELTGDSLWLSTNSPARMTRLRALIDPVVSGLVGAPFSEVQSIDELMAASPSNDGRVRPSDLSTADERKMIWDMMDRHYIAVLDEPVPFLDGMSPLAAISSDDGRLKTADWLKYLENQASKVQPGETAYGYDFAWMWERLGIAHLRR